MSSVAKIDENDKPTLLAYNETTGSVESMRVDAIFGALEMYAINIATSVPSSLKNAKIDGNDNPTLLGWNETTGQIEALRCDDSGNLLITLAT